MSNSITLKFKITVFHHHHNWSVYINYVKISRIGSSMSSNQCTIQKAMAVWTSYEGHCHKFCHKFLRLFQLSPVCPDPILCYIRETKYSSTWGQNVLEWKTRWGQTFWCLKVSLTWTNLTAVSNVSRNPYKFPGDCVPVRVKISRSSKYSVAINKFRYWDSFRYRLYFAE